MSEAGDVPMTDLVEVTQGRPVPAEYSYSPSRITLYGVPIFALEMGQQGTIVCTPDPPHPERTLALVYGFCFQGHCYSLPEPVIVLVAGAGRHADGCGWENQGYRAWDVDKLDQTIQLQVQGDTFEQLILNRNLNTTKQPVAYSIAHRMAHRGGKLTE
jgi:hypothetical protein